MLGPKFDSIDTAFPETPLSEEELRKLNAQLDNLFGPKDGVVYEIIQVYKSKGAILHFVQAVKQALNNPYFGGMVAADTEIGVAPIRPAHLTLATGTTADGDRFKITFSGNAWATIAEGSMDKDAGVLIFGIIDFYDGSTATARIDGIQVTVGQRTLLPLDVSNAALKDNRNGVPIWNFNSIPIMPDEYYKIQVHTPNPGTSSSTKTGIIKLIGLTVARGRFLKQNF